MAVSAVNKEMYVTNKNQGLVVVEQVVWLKVVVQSASRLVSTERQRTRLLVGIVELEELEQEVELDVEEVDVRVDLLVDVPVVELEDERVDSIGVRNTKTMSAM